MAIATIEMRGLANDWEAAIPSAVCVGIVGDANHGYGYHRAANEIPASDYSRQLAGDRNGIDPNAADAIDMAHNPADMITVTRRYYNSWKDPNDLRLNYTREVIGTLDGRTVIYMDTQSGQQGTADRSHLTHNHVGGLRCNAHNGHAMKAVLSVAVGESWADYCRNHPDDPITHGAQPSTPPPPPPPPPFPLPSGHCYGPKTDPRAWVHGGYYGWEQPNVKRIQQRLQALGYAPSYAGWADGVWESPTTPPVRSFQGKHGLVQDGLVGPITWGRLFS